jgi:hypothetical protein
LSAAATARQALISAGVGDFAFMPIGQDETDFARNEFAACRKSFAAGGKKKDVFLEMGF